MDTFMDKLAQKLTAQEMIKANMAADAEEMNQLKGKVKEYSECLEQLKKLIEDGARKLEDAKVDGGEIDRLVEESIAKINEMQKNTEVLEALEGFKKQQGEMIDNVNENVHKECVKVYRNVQAVVVEENGKQTENLSTSLNGIRSKLNAVLGISIAALVVALGSLAVQIMNLLNIKLF